jgi:cytochrome c biogenesis protein
MWVIGALTVAMAVATVIPQNAPEEAYLKAFGTLLGPPLFRSVLSHMYGSWQFIGLFGLLAVNLLACAIQRASRLLRQGADAPTKVTRALLSGRPQQARWRTTRTLEEAAGSLAVALRKSGYAVSEVSGEESGQRALVARRGRLTSWAPVLVHVGMALVLLGAAWGRLPRNAYQKKAPLQPGQTFPVKLKDGAFGLRLLEAGAERDAKGRPTEYWAKLEVLEEGSVIRSTLVRMNHPLRYHGVSVVLESLSSSGHGVRVTKGKATGMIPVTLAPDGHVDMMSTVRRLDDPPWVVFIHDFQEKDEHGHAHPAARVYVDESGELSHNWKELGWVGAEGVEFAGAQFKLVSMESGATLGLDRDVGIPSVYLGFLIISLGTILVLGGPRRSMVALVSGKSKGVQVLVGASGAGSAQELERLSQTLEADLGATRETDASRKEERV